MGGSGDAAAIFVWVDVSRHFGLVVTPKSCETVDEQSVRSISEQREQTKKLKVQHITSAELVTDRFLVKSNALDVWTIFTCPVPFGPEKCGAV